MRHKPIDFVYKYAVSLPLLLLVLTNQITNCGAEYLTSNINIPCNGTKIILLFGKGPIQSDSFESALI
jgi:hypothetical protein